MANKKDKNLLNNED